MPAGHQGRAEGWHLRLLKRISYRNLWRLAVFVVGCSVVIVGVAMVVLPGPAVVVIPLGLAILGAEFEWARRLLRRAKEGFDSVRTNRNKKEDEKPNESDPPRRE